MFSCFGDQHVQDRMENLEFPGDGLAPPPVTDPLRRDCGLGAARGGTENHRLASTNQSSAGRGAGRGAGIGIQPREAVAKHSTRTNTISIHSVNRPSTWADTLARLG